MPSTVSIIDATINAVIGAVGVGIAPLGVDVDQTGTRLLVANGFSNSVSVIDTSTNTVIATIPVGELPTALGHFIAPATCVGFIDIAVSSPFCPSVEWLKNRAITAGFTATEYCLTNDVSRLGMVAFMKRLGGALTATVLWKQESPGAIDLDTSVSVCQTTDFSQHDYPRRAFVDIVFSAKATGDADLLAEAVVSFDGGQSWFSTASVARPITVTANHWAVTRGSQVHDLALGATTRFGIRVNRSGTSTTSDLTESNCAIRVLVGNRDSSVSPLYTH